MINYSRGFYEDIRANAPVINYSCLIYEEIRANAPRFNYSYHSTFIFDFMANAPDVDYPLPISFCPVVGLT